ACFRYHDPGPGADAAIVAQQGGAGRSPRAVIVRPARLQCAAATGWMAAWSCSGLHLRVRRFDSDSSLHTLRSRIVPRWRAAAPWLKVSPTPRPSGGTGRHKGLETI